MSQSLDSYQLQEYKKLQSEGKQLAAEGRLKESLQKFELALKICPTEKVLKRIDKLKEHINAIERESLNKTRNQSVSSDFSSKRSDKISPTSFTVPKVLNDIQNVQILDKSRLCTTSTDLSPISQSKFRELKKLAKESAYDGKYEKALEYFKKALSICDCPNVKKYMKEIKEVMKNSPANISITEDVSPRRKEVVVHKQTERKSLYSGYNSKQNPEAFEQQATSKSISPEAPSGFSGDSVLKTQSLQSVEDNTPDLEKKLGEVKVLYEEARVLAAEGKLPDALKLLEKAQSVHKTDKVQKRIVKIKELISADLNDSNSNEMIKVAEDFSIFHDIYNKLYPYQREGVAWMWKLYKVGKGGVLGDDMGLGKTFQVIAFISGMIDADLVKHVLIIMPVSLLRNWAKEFKKWCPGIIVHDFHSGSKKERERNLLKVQKRGHVLLTSYGMIVNNVNSMIEIEGREFVWDYVILDEGHKIKNPTKTTKAVYEIPSKNRLVLTGTPIQNNLRELWSLYDFVQQGTLLGSLKTFKLQYENPITRSREKDATAGEKRLGTEIAENLKSLIKPYFLRRTKDEIWKKKKDDDDDVEQLGSQIEKMAISRLNAKKNDLILWTYMSDPQIEIYNSFLHSDAVKSILLTKRSPLVELTTLKKICDHPRLLTKRACLQLGLDGDLQAEDLERELEDESTMASSINNVPDETLLQESGKLKLVLQLLEKLKEDGHRTLVFSLSRKILDMIHRILVNKDWKVMRLDGTIAKTEERERRIQRFQNDSSYPVFLLTTQVGGVGITLTAADRVIIYDPSWNPATDAQAVDRVFRIGQEKDVIVYRLITCGSVEEKIYRRQVFKDSITRQATGVADPYRYFSKQELRELFTFDNPHYSATQVQLSEMHSSQRLADDFLDKHINFLQTLNIFGISDHDLMFSKNIQDSTEDCDKAAISEDYIKKQVAAAHELIKMEASVVAEGMRLANSYSRPYQEFVPVLKRSTKDSTYKPPVLPDVIDLTEDAVDVFPSPKQKTLEPKSPDSAIKTRSPDSNYQGSPLDEKQYSSPTQAKSDEVSSMKEQEKASSILSLAMHDRFPSNFMVKNEELIEPDGLNMSYNIERLRKSLDCPEPSAPLQDMVETLIDESVYCDRKASLDSEKISSDDKNYYDENVCPSLAFKKNVLDVYENLATDELQDKVQSLIGVLRNDLKDLDLEPELPQTSVKGSRRSCARKSTLMISDSESSHCSSDVSNVTDNLVEDSDDAASLADDSSNSANVSFVPNSSSNTPETVKFPKTAHFVSETPPTISFFEPESLPENLSFEKGNSNLRKLEGSVRRITPLKVDKNQTPTNSSFVQAMAAAVVLSPYNSPEKHVKLPSSASESPSCSFENRNKDLSLSLNDSPIKFIRKKKPQQICSDSDESDIEVLSATNRSMHSSEENKSNFQNTMSFNSVVEDVESNSDDDSENSVPGDHNSDGEISLVEDVESNSDDDSENSVPGDHNNDGEISALSTSNVHDSYRDSEHSSKSDEESVQSDSENSYASEDGSHLEHQLSDESGSVFSGDDSETDQD